MSNGFKLSAVFYDEGYKKGAAEMRERCATLADSQAAHAAICRIGGITGAVAGEETARTISAAIRALELDDTQALPVPATSPRP